MRKESLQKYQIGKEMYLTNNYSLTSICNELGIGRKWFTAWLKEGGIKIINKQNSVRVNDSVFNTIDSEEKAYWLGFLYADGNVSKNTNRIEISLKYDDKEHLEKLKDFLSFQGELLEKNVSLNNKNYKAMRLSFRSENIKKDLIQLGCVPNKSLILKFPSCKQVPKSLLKHFVRGYFDGDGSIMWNTSRNGGRISILGTKDFLEQLIIEMGWQTNKIDKKGEAYDIEYGGRQDSLLKLNQLYENSQIYLQRKFDIYKEIKCAVLGGNS